MAVRRSARSAKGSWVGGSATRSGRRASSRGSKGAAELGERGREILALLLLALGLFLAISALSYRYTAIDPRISGDELNWGGLFGWYLAGFFLQSFGLASYLFFAFLLWWGLLLFRQRDLTRPSLRVFGALALVLVLAILLSGTQLRGAGPRTPLGLGGGLGHLFAPRLYHSFGTLGALLLLGLTAAVAFLVATDWAPSAVLADLRGVLARSRSREEDAERGSLWRRGLALAFAGLGGARRKVGGLFEPVEATEPEVEPEGEEEPAPKGWRERRESRKKEPDDSPASEKPKATEALRVELTQELRRSRRKPRQPGRYRFPPIELLEPSDESASGLSREELAVAAGTIERRLQSHGVDARVVCISHGPAVTVYELELAEGQSVLVMNRFGPDLAAALKAISIRIVAPIPGKHTVGVEVPNPKRAIVRLRDLVEIQGVGRAKETVPLFLGRDVAGQPMVEDLARMPHLLIAGATGSGKSVCINAILTSILMTKTPDEVRLILIDPKMVELQSFRTIPHLLCPVVTHMKRAPGVLAWAVETMDERYALLMKTGVRTITDYNALGERRLAERLGPAHDPETTPTKLPHIVLVIDEFADLMAVSANDVEVSIQRLAQKSRAVGLHVILATQRPSRDVITGLIKANMPTRLAFQVSSKTDSRVVLDANGAEQLLGHGDLLYVPPGTNRLVRAQGAFVTSEEILGIVEFLEQNTSEQDFEASLVQLPTGSKRGPRDRDELYEEAVRAILEEQRGSATLLQRKLSIGYTRASRLIDLMTEDGVVGKFVGSKSREVLLSLEEWEEREGRQAAGPMDPMAAEPVSAAPATVAMDRAELEAFAEPEVETEDETDADEPGDGSLAVETEEVAEEEDEEVGEDDGEYEYEYEEEGDEEGDEEEGEEEYEEEYEEGDDEEDEEDEEGEEYEEEDEEDGEEYEEEDETDGEEDEEADER